MIPVSVAKPPYRQMLVEDVRLLVLGAQMMSDEEYEQHVLEALGMAKLVRVVLLVILGEPGMDPKRRARLVESGLQAVPHAVLTDSAKIRGILTALGWIGGKSRPFERNEFDKACDHLEIPHTTRARLVARIASSCQELEANEVRAPAQTPESASGLTPFRATIEAVKRAVTTRTENIKKTPTVPPQKS